MSKKLEKLSSFFYQLSLVCEKVSKDCELLLLNIVSKFFSYLDFSVKCSVKLHQTLFLNLPK